MSDPMQCVKILCNSNYSMIIVCPSSYPQTMKEDIERKTSELAHLLRDHRDRYTNNRLPPELESQAEEVTDLSEQVVALLREQDAQMIAARKSRSLAQSGVRRLSDWLDQAEERVKLRPEDVKEGKQQQEVINK